MRNYEELYDLLFDYANLRTEVERILVGLNWTLCRAGSIGMAQTCSGDGHGNPDFSTPLKGYSLAELSLWLRKWERRQASVGLAAVNAAVNREADMVYMEGALFKGRQAFHSSLDWFMPRMAGQQVVVAGSAATAWAKAASMDITALELPEAVTPRAEQLLPRADWVFLPAHAIADKTLPRLLELSAGATCVLYGTEVPWLEEWGEFGVDYLLGSQVDDHELLYTLVAEGAAETALCQALSYRLIAYDKAAESHHDIALPVQAIRYG
jgi:uncharacterized protein (DUF4213/DUF364 family)